MHPSGRRCSARNTSAQGNPTRSAIHTRQNINTPAVPGHRSPRAHTHREQHRGHPPKPGRSIATRSPDRSSTPRQDHHHRRPAHAGHAPRSTTPRSPPTPAGATQAHAAPRRARAHRIRAKPRTSPRATPPPHRSESGFDPASQPNLYAAPSPPVLRYNHPTARGAATPLRSTR